MDDQSRRLMRTIHLLIDGLGLHYCLCAGQLQSKHIFLDVFFSSLIISGLKLDLDITLTILHFTVLSYIYFYLVYNIQNPGIWIY